MGDNLQQKRFNSNKEEKETDKDCIDIVEDEEVLKVIGSHEIIDDAFLELADDNEGRQDSVKQSDFVEQFISNGSEAKKVVELDHDKDFKSKEGKRVMITIEDDNDMKKSVQSKEKDVSRPQRERTGVTSRSIQSRGLGKALPSSQVEEQKASQKNDARSAGGVLEIAGLTNHGPYSRVLIVGDSRLQSLEDNWPQYPFIRPQFLIEPYLKITDLKEYIMSRTKLPHLENGTLLICSVGIHDIITLEDLGNCFPIRNHKPMKIMSLAEKAVEDLIKIVLMRLNKAYEELEKTLDSSSVICFSAILPCDPVVFFDEQAKSHTPRGHTSMGASFREQLDFLKSKINLVCARVNKHFDAFNPLPSVWDIMSTYHLDRKILGRVFVDGINISPMTSQLLASRLNRFLQELYYGVEINTKFVEFNNDQEVIVVGDSRVMELEKVWRGDKPQFFCEPNLGFYNFDKFIREKLHGLKNTIVIMSLGLNDLIQFVDDETCLCEGHEPCQIPVSVCEKYGSAKKYLEKIMENFRRSFTLFCEKNNVLMLFATIYPIHLHTYINSAVKIHKEKTGHAIAPCQRSSTRDAKLHDLLSRMNSLLRRMSSEHSLPLWDMYHVVCRGFSASTMNVDVLRDGIYPSERTAEELIRSYFSFVNKQLTQEFVEDKRGYKFPFRPLPSSNIVSEERAGMLKDPLPDFPGNTSEIFDERGKQKPNKTSASNNAEDPKVSLGNTHQIPIVKAKEVPMFAWGNVPISIGAKFVKKESMVSLGQEQEVEPKLSNHKKKNYSSMPPGASGSHHPNFESGTSGQKHLSRPVPERHSPSTSHHAEEKREHNHPSKRSPVGGRRSMTSPIRSPDSFSQEKKYPHSPERQSHMAKRSYPVLETRRYGYPSPDRDFLLRISRSPEREKSYGRSWSPPPRGRSRSRSPRYRRQSRSRSPPYRRQSRSRSPRYKGRSKYSRSPDRPLRSERKRSRSPCYRGRSKYSQSPDRLRSPSYSRSPDSYRPKKGQESKSGDVMETYQKSIEIIRKQCQKEKDPVIRRALHDLCDTHIHECDLYLDKPDAHPDYSKEYRHFLEKKKDFILSLGGDPSTYDYVTEWKKFWPTHIIELFEKSWKTKKNEVLSMMCVRKSRSPSLRASKRTSSPSSSSRGSTPEWKSKGSKKKVSKHYQHSPVHQKKKFVESSPERKKSKGSECLSEYKGKESKALRSPSLRASKRSSSPSSSSRGSTPEWKRKGSKKKVSSPECKKSRVSECLSEFKGKESKADSHEYIENRSYKKLDELDKVTQSIMYSDKVTSVQNKMEKNTPKVVEVLGVLTYIKDKLGVYGVPVSIFYEKAVEMGKEGLDPNILLEDNEALTMFSMIRERLAVLMNEDHSTIQKAIILEAHSLLVTLLDKIREMKKKSDVKLMVDIKKMARLTQGSSIEETIMNIKNFLVYEGFSDISKEDLESIYMSVKDEQLKLSNLTSGHACVGRSASSSSRFDLTLQKSYSHENTQSNLSLANTAPPQDELTEEFFIGQRSFSNQGVKLSQSSAVKASTSKLDMPAELDEEFFTGKKFFKPNDFDRSESVEETQSTINIPHNRMAPPPAPMISGKTFSHLPQNPQSQSLPGPSLYKRPQESDTGEYRLLQRYLGSFQNISK